MTTVSYVNLPNVLLADSNYFSTQCVRTNIPRRQVRQPRHARYSTRHLFKSITTLFVYLHGHTHSIQVSSVNGTCHKELSSHIRKHSFALVTLLYAQSASSLPLLGDIDGCIEIGCSLPFYDLLCRGAVVVLLRFRLLCARMVWLSSSSGEMP